MDVSAYLELKIAPRAVFDSLPERRSRVRFMVPSGNDWTAVTWGAYAQQIREISLFMVSAGVKSGDRAAVLAPNRVEWMSAALGIQSIGGVMVPIYPNSTAEQIGYILRHSDARVVFVDTPELLSRLYQAWADLDGVKKIVLLDDAVDPVKVLHGLRTAGQQVPSYADVEPRVIWLSNACEIGNALGEEEPALFENLMNSVSLDQFGTMLYTSGTTGPPKGVPLTHRNVAVNGRDWLQSNASLVDEGSVDLLWLPMSHIFGFGEACLGNTLGFMTYLSDPVSALAKLPEVRPNIFMSVPRYFEKIAQLAAAEKDPERRKKKLAEITGGRFRFCLSGGAGLKKEVKEFFWENGILIIEGYGLTEASPTITLNRPDAFRFDSVGKPFPSVEVKLAEDGEILAKGESIFSGYHKDPAATKEAFTEDGWLKTGDLGRFTDDGYVQIIGRKKEILVTAGGKNISPVNIENRFMDDPYFAQVVLWGDGEGYLVAGVWPNEAAIIAKLGADASDQEIHAFLSPRIEKANGDLARYETIKKFVVIREPLTVEAGFLTPTLKVKRKQVYATFSDRVLPLYKG
jgi:long-chain acyl-CoA synthetase